MICDCNELHNFRVRLLKFLKREKRHETLYIPQIELLTERFKNTQLHFRALQWKAPLSG